MTRAELRKLLTEATPGPFVAEFVDNQCVRERYEIVGPVNRKLGGKYQTVLAEAFTEADATFIVAAVNALGPLLDLVEELEAKLERAVVEIERRSDWDANRPSCCARAAGKGDYHAVNRLNQQNADLQAQLNRLHTAVKEQLQYDTVSILDGTPEHRAQAELARLRRLEAAVLAWDTSTLRRLEAAVLAWGDNPIVATGFEEHQSLNAAIAECRAALAEVTK